MQRDYLGNPVGAQRDPTLHRIDDFIEGYLAYESRAERILAAADAEPESCLGNAYSGMLWMLLEAPEGARHAAKYLGAAERAGGGAARGGSGGGAGGAGAARAAGGETTKSGVAGGLGRRRHGAD